MTWNFDWKWCCDCDLDSAAGEWGPGCLSAVAWEKLCAVHPVVLVLEVQETRHIAEVKLRVVTCCDSLIVVVDG
jgi:hypothetical protein